MSAAKDNSFSPFENTNQECLIVVFKQEQADRYAINHQDFDRHILD